jgi:hypothetical protein
MADNSLIFRLQSRYIRMQYSFQRPPVPGYRNKELKKVKIWLEKCNIRQENVCFYYFMQFLRDYKRIL